MRRRKQHEGKLSVAGVAVLLLSASACGESRNDYADLAPSDVERTKVAKLQTLFKDTRERLGNRYLAADGCKVYRSREEKRSDRGLGSGGAHARWLPGVHDRLRGHGRRRVGGILVFRVCQQAIGAGGGCQRGGLFRARDGMAWECAAGGTSSRSNSYATDKEPPPWKPCSAR